MTILTKTAVQEALDAAIAARGADFVYTESDEYDGNCYYAAEGPVGEFAPSCVVGFVVDAIDHEAFKRLAADEAVNDTFDAGALSGHRGVSLGIEVEENLVADALQLAQEAQDAGLPWGKAREFAVRRLEGESYFEIRRDLTAAIAATNGW